MAEDEKPVQAPTVPEAGVEEVAVAGAAMDPVVAQRRTLDGR